MGLRINLMGRLAETETGLVLGKSEGDLKNWVKHVHLNGFHGYDKRSLLSMVNEFNDQFPKEKIEQHSQYTQQLWKHAVAHEGELGGYWWWVERQIKLNGENDD